MHISSMHYFPLAWPFLLALFGLVALLLALIELNILRYAYARMGVPPRYVLWILLLSLFGSAINIPVAELPPEEVTSDRTVSANGVSYVVPVVEDWPRTIIAINLGGALVPTILSLYLMFKNRLFLSAIIGIAIVTLVTHLLARPIRGVGIAVPTLVPPFVAALAAMILYWRRAAPLAYVSGTLGTLLGADILNLNRIHGLGAPIASIGGAGTFDGVFLTGIVAVLLSPVSDLPVQPRGEGVQNDER